MIILHLATHDIHDTHDTHEQGGKLKRFIIGVAGGTGSGKTTVVKAILERLPKNKVAIIHQDTYYRDQSHLPLTERKKINYDHPLAFDQNLLIEHIKKLLKGIAVRQPLYSFVSYTRKKKTRKILPKDIYILEGILVLEDKRLRDLLDIKIYVDTDSDERFIRRLQRDIKERGRTVEEVVRQYLNVVRPMHLEFVEFTKRYADIIIPEGGQNQVAIDIITTKIKDILRNKKKEKFKIQNTKYKNKAI